MSRLRTRVTAAVAITAAGAMLAACGGGSSGKNGAGDSLTVLYSNNYVFNSGELAKEWWKGIADEWKQKYPNVKLNLVGTGGTDVDLMNKAALQFRNKSQAPDVIQLPTTYVGQFGGSGYLAPLNSYVTGAKSPAWWKNMPKTVQDMSSVDGKIYAVNAGNNNSGILYNKKILTKAGIAMPWAPKTWADVLDAAQKVHAADPQVSALWLAAGVAPGPTNVLQGSGNLIYGSTNPDMYNDSTKKWVIDSPGLRATLQFYKDLFSKGLGAPTSQLFRTDAVGQPPQLMQQGKIAIAFGSNWYPTVWADSGGAASWPAAKTDVGVAPVPSENGQAPGASTLGGWAWAIGKNSSNAGAAWNFIQLAQERTNQLHTALWAGFVPPDQTVGQLPEFVNFAPPFMAAFNSYSAFAKGLPNSPDFPIYARALNTVTGDIAQHPDASIDTELAKLKSMVTQQLGPDSVETQQ